MKVPTTARVNAPTDAAAKPSAPTPRRLAALLLGLSMACSGCSPEQGPPAARDLFGEIHRPTKPRGDAIHVLIFTSCECPIANAYAPTLGALQGAWDAEPRVRLYLVHVDPDLTVEGARQHAADYALPGTILLDPAHRVAAACGATITPEAVVLSSQGQTYRGRIDDQWRALGSRAAVASTHDLATAVRQTLAGERVSEPHPAAIGCLLPAPRR